MPGFCAAVQTVRVTTCDDGWRHDEISVNPWHGQSVDDICATAQFRECAAGGARVRQDYIGDGFTLTDTSTVIDRWPLELGTVTVLGPDPDGE